MRQYIFYVDYQTDENRWVIHHSESFGESGTLAADVLLDCFLRRITEYLRAGARNLKCQIRVNRYSDCSVSSALVSLFTIDELDKETCDMIDSQIGKAYAMMNAKIDKTRYILEITQSRCQHPLDNGDEDILYFLSSRLDQTIDKRQAGHFSHEVADYQSRLWREKGWCVEAVEVKDKKVKA